MTWEAIVEMFGGQPVYLPPRNPPETPLLVLHDTGVSLAEPLYDKVVPVLDWLGRLGLVDLLEIGGKSLLDPLESIVLGVTVKGIPLTIPVFIVCLVIAGYVSKNLHKHEHRSVGSSPTAETAHEILLDYFGTQLIL